MNIAAISTSEVSLKKLCQFSEKKDFFSQIDFILLQLKNGFMKDVMFELNGSQKKILKLKDRQMLKPNKEVSDG